MKEDLDRELCRKYPKIFRDRHGDMRQTLMCFGFEVGNGWSHILDALCANIQSHVNHSRKERARALRYNRALKRAVNGDVRGLERYHSLNGKVTDWTKKRVKEDVADPRYRAVPDAVPQVVAVQVKEKFSTLRFYINGGDEVIYAYINMAESMSARICEVCGSPGKVYRDGWHTTLCPTHAAEQHREDEIEEEENVE